jgi:serine protease AprX
MISSATFEQWSSLRRPASSGATAAGLATPARETETAGRGTSLETGQATHSHGWALSEHLSLPERLGADSATGRGVTIAFIDSGFAAHPDLGAADGRLRAFHDVDDRERRAPRRGAPRDSDWHGTQTAVVGAGNGALSGGRFRALACEAGVVLVAVGGSGRIGEEEIARGFEWVLAHARELGIRVVSISLGADRDAPLAESRVNALAEEAVSLGIVVVAAAGNSGCSDRHASVPPATSPSVLTVGGYQEEGEPDRRRLALYCSSFGLTRDGLVKPEIIALARSVAAPILADTPQYARASALASIAAAEDADMDGALAELNSDPAALEGLGPSAIRAWAERTLSAERIVAAHYQVVDGTSFAAPIVASVVAQMLEVNPRLTPAGVRSLLLATADRIGDAAPIRQGHGILNARRAVEAARRERHATDAAAFRPPHVKAGRIVFVLHEDTASEVSVAGDFNGWDAARGRLRRCMDGLWHAEFSAPPPGRCRYKYVVDGRWREDPTHGAKEPDPFGGFNSFLEIP